MPTKQSAAGYLWMNWVILMSDDPELFVRVGVAEHLVQLLDYVQPVLIYSLYFIWS